MNVYYKFSDKEINELLKHMTIISDTREKSNVHVLEFFKKKNIPYKIQTLESADYGCMIPFNEETEKFGVKRDLYFDIFVERKNGLDEICGNLSKDKQQAFINELIRLQGKNFVLFVEDKDFDRNLAMGNYISKYDPKALKGRLESLQAKYGFEIRPVDKELMGYMIYNRFYYQVRNVLKSVTF